MKTLNIVLAVLVALLAANLVFGQNQVVKDVKSGMATLECDLDQGYMKIDPTKVVDFYPDESYWKFTNGGAKTCNVVYPE